MRAVGIVGFKKSGKTSLLVELARELTSRGYRVSSVKHSSGALDLPQTDTALHKEFAHQSAAISPEESAIFFNSSMKLEQILDYIKADFVLIEGFKSQKTFPKIVCLRAEDDPEALLDGLEICVVGEISEKKGINVPVLDAKGDVGAIADLIEQKAFKLPNLDCGACGYKTCYEMALEIIKGNKTMKNCLSLNSEVMLKIDGETMPLKPFVSDIVRNTITGLLSSLKGYREGKIEIDIEK